MITRQVTENCLNRLGMLKFFPSRAEVIAEVGRLLNELCPNDAAAVKLTARVLENYAEWPGPKGIKEVHQYSCGRLIKVDTMDPETKRRIEALRKTPPGAAESIE